MTMPAQKLKSRIEDSNSLSFVLEKPYSVRFEDRPVPQLGPHDVLVNVKFTGICGSDVHYWSHGAIGEFVVKEPMVLGHESSGIVVATGDQVSQLEVGDRVAVEPGVPCRMCVRCKEGHYNLCFDMRFAATPPIDGTLTKYYSSPEDLCYKLPDNVSLEEGALVEPLGVGVHIVKQAEIEPGQSVVVFGAGPVGLLCCAVARAFGAERIVAVDINAQRLEFARGYAATHTWESQRIPATEAAAAIIAECGLGHGADVAIDASGAEPCIQTAIHVVRNGGVYVQGGMGRPDITFPIGMMCSKELTVRGSFRYRAGDYELAVKLLASGKLSVKELITGVYPFKEAEKAFQEVKAATGVKALIEGPL
ncbi:putative xylitol dehydrogenase [Polychaeton citri CBS 116435]|uniref:D-xylulose reductase n=1 Tax=Polychaeton citri CBS 116435 TaxID=1314669 RepID=A0A9P4Q1C9_9PEZI|nr:putative xylitol dehydrogenase [Polychaeton citri CBS 116435]